MITMEYKPVFRWGFLFVSAVAATIAWYLIVFRNADDLPTYIASGNGRIEATEYDIATKYAGRLASVLADEGNMVVQGQLLARMDTYTLETRMLEAEAELSEVRIQREYAEAMVSVRRSELQYARREKERAVKLSKANNISQKKLDQAQTYHDTAAAALKAAQIKVTAAEAGVEAAKARIARVRSELAETRLVAPVDGRILYRLAQPGEVLGGGGRVLTLLDLTDVYMTIFVPTAQAGRIFIGSEARIRLDALPEYVIPASVSFVAPRTQFTPKAVETREARAKLMFRVKIKIDPTLLRRYIQAVKTGVPGEAFILMDRGHSWPEALQIRLPQ